jgi:hypothetical protein
MMPFGVDVLGTLSEKLKQLTNEAKDHHNSFIELTKLYKGEKINEKDFFSKILNYVVTTSALTFLMGWGNIGNEIRVGKRYDDKRCYWGSVFSFPNGWFRD